jgi:hypothetical protein
MELIMKKASLVLSILIISIILLSACNMPATKTGPTTESDMAYTAAALTVQAKIHGYTPEPTQPIQGQEQPVQQSTAAPNPQPVYTAAPVDSDAPCDRALFVEDITILDNTQIDPGGAFTKIWLIQNDGSCTWTKDYAIVFDSGDQMNGPESIAINNDVPPGYALEISVNLKAPTESKTYRGNWMLRNASGKKFGLSDFNDPFWVIIKVDAPPVPSFVVSTASFEMIPGSYTGVCPFPVTLRGTITTSGSGKVTYYYQREDGYRSDTMEITFDAGGQKSLPDFSMPIGAGAGYAWTGKIWLYIDNPNHQAFGEQVFSVNCVSP